MVSDTKRGRELILSLLEKRRIIQRKDTITYLKKNGVSPAAANRHIKKLEKENQIKILKYPEYKKYGISEDNKTSSYLILASDTKQAQYYDTVIAALHSKDSLERSNALREIQSISNIQLLPEQITMLSNILKIKEGHKLSNIIREHFEKFIFPSNLKTFQNNLIQAFKKHCSKIDPNITVREDIIHILGILDNPTVIDFFKKDIQQIKDLSTIVHNYETWTIAYLMEKYKTELFLFSNSLPEHKSKVVFNIRRQATKNLPRYRNRISHYKERLAVLEEEK